MLAGGGFDHGQALSAAHVYEVSSGAWRPGPPLPEPRTWGRAVQWRDSFLLVGGGADSDPSAEMREDILAFDADAEAWRALPQKLDDPTVVMVALVAPKDFVADCQ